LEDDTIAIGTDCVIGDDVVVRIGVKRDAVVGVVARGVVGDGVGQADFEADAFGTAVTCVVAGGVVGDRVAGGGLEIDAEVFVVGGYVACDGVVVCARFRDMDSGAGAAANSNIVFEDVVRAATDIHPVLEIVSDSVVCDGVAGAVVETDRDGVIGDCVAGDRVAGA